MDTDRPAKHKRRSGSKQWVKLWREEIVIADELLVPKFRVTIEIPWTWDRERRKSRAL